MAVEFSDMSRFPVDAANAHNSAMRSSRFLLGVANASPHVHRLVEILEWALEGLVDILRSGEKDGRLLEATNRVRTFPGVCEWLLTSWATLCVLIVETGHRHLVIRSMTTQILTRRSHRFSPVVHSLMLDVLDSIIDIGWWTKERS